MTATVHLDELTELHVKDPAKLIPGARVLLGHVPLLTGNPYFEEVKQEAWASFATVIEVKEASFNELHGFNHVEEWANKLATVMLYKPEFNQLDTEPKNPAYKFLSDLGVTESYTTTNFVVLASEVEAAGLTFSLDISEKFQELLNVYNDQVVEYRGDYTDDLL
jgi:hypothetical protein